jgi:membrane dipeptidase
MRYHFELSEAQEQRAKAIHQRAIIVDAAVIAESLEYAKDVESMRIGGLTVGCCTVAHWPENYVRATQRIDKYKQLIQKDDRLHLASSVQEIRTAKSLGKLGIIFSFQDGKPIEDDLANLRTFYELGVRIIQLTYNSQNLIGVGCAERSCGKLSYYGVEVVKEMNRLGIVIDLSHCCDETTIDAVEISEDPVLFSHSSCRALCNAYGRNKTDEQIKALAEKGGVIGVCWQPFLIKRDPATYEVQKCTIEDVLRHIEYMVRLVGVDHVGFGSDQQLGKSLDEGTVPWYSSFRLWRPIRPDVFGSGPTDVYDPFPEGLGRHSDLLNLTRGLVWRGYSDEDILKILGGNFLRVFEAVWKK